MLVKLNRPPDPNWVVAIPVQFVTGNARLGEAPAPIHTLQNKPPRGRRLNRAADPITHHWDTRKNCDVLVVGAVALFRFAIKTASSR